MLVVTVVPMLICRYGGECQLDDTDPLSHYHHEMPLCLKVNLPSHPFLHILLLLQVDRWVTVQQVTDAFRHLSAQVDPTAEMQQAVGLQAMCYTVWLLPAGYDVLGCLIFLCFFLFFFFSCMRAFSRQHFFNMCAGYFIAVTVLFSFLCAQQFIIYMTDFVCSVVLSIFFPLPARNF